ncbi:MAG: lysozyme [Pseudomonadota bacterium]
MRTTQAGVDLITRFEGFRARSEALTDRGYVIGYGHTRHAKANQKITKEDALTLLKGHDLPPIEKAIAARSLAPLGPNEFDALVAFAFNIGLDNFLDSDVFALVNSGAKLNAAEAMAAWRKARVDGRVIVVDALVRRRAAERALFLEVPGGPTPAATPVVRPMLDLATAILHPRDPFEGLVPCEETGEEAPEAETAADQDAPDQEDETDIPDAPAEEIAPQVAARNVTERLTRILGEDVPASNPSDASVAEITKAVSALADPLDDDEDDGEPISSEVPEPVSESSGGAEPVPDDPVAAAAISSIASQLRNGEPELAEIREADDGQPRSSETPIMANGNGGHDDLEALEEITLGRGESARVVDDLEPLHLPEGRVPEAEVQGPSAPWASLILYGLSAFGGALTGAWGLHDLRSTMRSNVPITSDWALYAGPFALLVGGLIFVIMGYYLLRALLSDS